MHQLHRDAFGLREAVESGRLADLLRRAGRTTAYAREWGPVGASGGEELIGTFQSLPFLHKEDLMRLAAEPDPFGGRLAVDREDLGHVFVAPGPIFAPYTRADVEAVASTFAWAFRLAGVTPGDLVDQTTMYNWVMAATILDTGLRQVGCGIVPGGTGDTQRHIEVLERLRVDVIVAFPTFLEHILREADAQGRHLSLRSGVVMGEFHDRAAKARMRDQHGVDVREFYATGEVGVVAAECVAGSGMHLNPGLIIEFIDPETQRECQPVPGRPAELVVTEFGRAAMPMVRYATGDLVDVLKTDECPCGLATPRISRIVGRLGEIAKVKGMFLVPANLAQVLRDHGIEGAMQLVLARNPGGQDQVTLRIAAAEPGDVSGVSGELYEAARMRFDIQWGVELEPDCERLQDTRVAGGSSNDAASC